MQKRAQRRLRMHSPRGWRRRGDLVSLGDIMLLCLHVRDLCLHHGCDDWKRLPTGWVSLGLQKSCARPHRLRLNQSDLVFAKLCARLLATLLHLCARKIHAPGHIGGKHSIIPFNYVRHLGHPSPYIPGQAEDLQAQGLGGDSPRQQR